MVFKTLILIIIPIIIITILFILYSTNIGLSIEENVVESIDGIKLFNTSCRSDFHLWVEQPENQISILTIKINNSFFLLKIFEVPNYELCIYDIDTKELKPISFGGIYVDGIEKERGSVVEIEPQTQKTIDLKVRPLYACRYPYKDYDFLLLIAKPEFGRVNCYDVNEEQIDKAIKIKIETFWNTTNPNITDTKSKYIKD